MEQTRAEELLKSILLSLNTLPNTRFTTLFNGRFKNTYEICSAIDKYFREKQQTNGKENKPSANNI